MYTGNILDPIHGLIKLSEIEKWVLGRKPFNRLRRIKQNTFLYLVFPSANHTRFEHSIGVMHLAHQIYLNANENYDTGAYKKLKYKVQQTKTFDFFSTTINLAEQEAVLVQELRLAALLHDVGHGPMSHKFDEYTITGRNLLEIVETDPVFEAFKKCFKDLVSGRDNEKVKHEIVSCVFIIKIIHDLKIAAKTTSGKFDDSQKALIESISPVRILKMIEPDFVASERIVSNGIDYSNFFSSIISAFPLDADRMDYLFRDSYFSGVKYGLYDLSRLLMSFIPVKHKNEVYLAIKESGVDSVIRFIQSRTHLFNQVYFHKTNRAANTMLDYACRKLEKSGSVITVNTYDEFESFYWNNSDELFLWNHLKTLINTPKENEVLDELLNRRLWKRIYQKKIVITPHDKFDIGRKLKDIKEKVSSTLRRLEEDGLDVAIDTFPNKVFKDYEKTRLKIIRKVDVDYILESDWKLFNKELKILEYEIHYVRIYLRRQFFSPEEFNVQKKKVLTAFVDITSILDEIN